MSDTDTDHSVAATIDSLIRRADRGQTLTVTPLNATTEGSDAVAAQRAYLAAESDDEDRGRAAGVPAAELEQGGA